MTATADDLLEIRRTARALLDDRFSDGRLLELVADGATADEVWAELVDLGWTGAAVAEAHGGAGLGTAALAGLVEELGRTLAPTPFLSSVAAALLVQHAGTDAQGERWLPALAAGELRGTVAVARDGACRLVPDLLGAAFVVVLDGDRAGVVEGSAVAATKVPTLDPTRPFGAFTLDRVAVQPLPGDVVRGRAALQVVLGAEAVGVAQRALELATEHARDRRQFGQPIGVNQAISHRCVEMLVKVEGARALVHEAALACDADADGPRVALAAAAARTAAGDAGWSVPASALQVFGGIGFTWEHPVHLLLRRGRVGATMLGSVREARAEVARLVLDAELPTQGMHEPRVDDRGAG